MPIDIRELIALLRSSTNADDVSEYERELRTLITKHGSPIVRADEAYFFATSEAAITGDWNGWKPTDKLTRLNEQSDYCCLKRKFQIDARLAYRLIINGNSTLDPLNPYKEEEVFGINSVLKMPGYREEPLSREPQGKITRGRIKEIEVPGQKNIG